jgi:hypothetical protein
LRAAIDCPSDSVTKKARDAETDANRGRCRMHRHIALTFGLDRDERFPTRLAHRHLLRRADHFAAVAVAQPAQLGEEDAAVGLIQLEALRKAKAVLRAAFSECGVVGDLVEEPLLSHVQAFQRMLERF